MKHPNLRILRNLARHRSLRTLISGKLLTGAFVMVLVVLDVWILHSRNGSAAPHRQADRIYTLAQLSLYDGSDPKLPVLIAMNGDVYDVSAGRKQFYDPGRPYHALVGTDATALLRIAGGEIIARKYPVVGRLK